MNVCCTWNNSTHIFTHNFYILLVAQLITKSSVHGRFNGSTKRMTSTSSYCKVDWTVRFIPRFSKRMVIYDNFWTAQIISRTQKSE